MSPKQVSPGLVPNSQEAFPPMRLSRLNAYLVILLVDALAVAVALALGAGLTGLVAGLSLALIAPGALLWWPHRRTPANEVELGAALFGGAVVAIAVLVLQLQQQRTADSQMHQQQALSDRQALQLTLSMNPKLREVDLHERDLSGFYLLRKDFNEAVLTDATLDRANIGFSTFRRATIEGAMIRDADLTAADLTGANLKSAHLEGSSFFLATFRGAQIDGVQLDNATLIRACLVNIDLKGVDLRGATLSEANLSGADLRRATLDDTTIFAPRRSKARPGLIYGAAFADEDTQWPLGFDHRAAGVVDVKNGKELRQAPWTNTAAYQLRPSHGCKL